MDFQLFQFSLKSKVPVMLPFLMIMAACFWIISPVSAEIGFTQKWIGTPSWFSEDVNTSVETDLFKKMTENRDASTETYKLVNEGKKYLRGGNYFDADHSFMRAMEFDENQFDARLGHALSLEGMKRYQGALDAYNYISTVREEKYAWMPLAGKGRALLETQKFADAAGVLQQAIDEFNKSAKDDSDNLKNLNEALAYANEKAGNKSGADAAKK